jgi:hypothetical protein
MVKNLFSWEIVGDRRSVKPKFVVYAVGQWDGHIMDWEGMNCRRTKVPDQPKFYSLKEARAWAVAHYEEFEQLVYGKEGSHISDCNDKFGERVLFDRQGDGPSSCYVNGETGEMSEEDWEEYIDMTMED